MRVTNSRQQEIRRAEPYPKQGSYLQKQGKRDLLFYDCVFFSLSALSLLSCDKMLVLPGVGKLGRGREALRLLQRYCTSCFKYPLMKKVRFFYSFYQTTYFFLPAYINKSIYASLFHVLYTEKKV